MTAQGQENIIIASSKWKYYLYAAVCWGLVLAGFITFHAPERQWQFWMAEVVLLLFALAITYMLLSPKYRFLDRNSPEMQTWLQQKYEDLLREKGLFDYNETGFVFHAETGDLNISWNEVHRISGHLEDVVTNDEDICLKLEYGDGHFLELDEEVEGWLLFRHKLREKFGFSPDWQEKLLDSGMREIEIYRKS